MARPHKPPPGTAERLQMDLADYGPTYRFVRDHINAAGAARGARHAAICEAAKAFGIDYKTAERRYQRIKKYDTPEGMSLLASGLLKQYKPVVDTALSLVSAAFSPEEIRQLATVGMDFVLQLARERLELIELRKRRLRK